MATSGMAPSYTEYIETARTLDSLLVLGGEGRDRRRSIHAAALYTEVNRNDPLHIVLTGGCSGLLTQPQNTPPESEQVHAYILSLGIPEAVLHYETESLDTLGNIVFARPILKDLSATRIGIVTDDYHMPRALWCTRRVLGSGYRIRPLPAAGMNVSLATLCREAAVRYAHQLDLWRAGIIAGDQEAFEIYMKTHHPFHTPHPPIGAYALGIRLMKGWELQRRNGTNA